ncbi:MAG: hypothetical protein U0Z44_01190 [Kouleothrix sp.]
MVFFGRVLVHQKAICKSRFVDNLTEKRRELIINITNAVNLIRPAASPEEPLFSTSSAYALLLWLCTVPDLAGLSAVDLVIHCLKITSSVHLIHPGWSKHVHTTCWLFLGFAVENIRSLAPFSASQSQATKVTHD